MLRCRDPFGPITDVWGRCVTPATTQWLTHKTGDIHMKKALLLLAMGALVLGSLSGCSDDGEGDPTDTPADSTAV